MKLTEKLLPGLTANRIKALTQAGINSTMDLIRYYPRTYIDRSQPLLIRELGSQLEGDVTLLVQLVSVGELGVHRSKRLQATFQDSSGQISGVWFKGISYYKKLLIPGKEYVLNGSPKLFRGTWSFAHPTLEPHTLDSVEDQSYQRVVPIYPSTTLFQKTYITSALLSKWVAQLLSTYSPKDYLPLEVKQRFSLIDLSQAVSTLHLPNYLAEVEQARYRLRFDEIFLFELSMEKLKARSQKRAKGILFHPPFQLSSTFTHSVLPFSLTEGQKKAIQDIHSDLISGHQMHRLLQGDVGSGKTVVALTAILMAIDNGYQTAFMAPTEILAEQHARTLSLYLSKLNISFRLLVGNQKTRQRREILDDIARGGCSIVVGTHALFQEKVHFNRLGLIVIDEQHRFGVAQRNDLLRKADHPHLLVMSATPIPRSLAMTLYGDLDVSIIQGMPAGRKPVKTAIRGESKRENVLSFVRNVLSEGGQVYVVYPLVEESEKVDLADATTGYQRLCSQFPDSVVGLVHGRMPADEKEAVMQRFISGEIHILVSTTVIEVGVDVPNASVMIIEHAERFGLSQLHQLRGRVGRGSRQSYCILMAGPKQSKEGRIRLETMARTNDGFKISEVDLELRGPGDLLGTKQSGLPDFQFFDLLKHQPLLEEVKPFAASFINNDPELNLPEHADLKRIFEPYFQKKAQFFHAG